MIKLIMKTPGIGWLTFILLVACSPTRSVDKPNDKEVVCFLYHRFGEDRYPSTNTSIGDFRAHLQYLQANGYQVLTFSAAMDYLKSPEPVQKTAVITIDDGYSSFYANALPLLREFGFPATLFINTQTVGGSGYMEWDELKESMAHRVEIGNHTHSHAYFLNLPPDSRYETFSDELKKSQELIRSRLKVEPEVFAYPFGEYDEKMKAIVKEAGFKAAALQKSGVIHDQTDAMLCPRFPMAEAYSDPEKFASKAVMRPLEVAEVTPSDPILTAQNDPPVLSLKVTSPDLQYDQLQCFVQGRACDIVLNQAGHIRVRASSSIADRRRTLYTITVPDVNGEWHWFSQLWINPDIKFQDIQ